MLLDVGNLHILLSEDLSGGTIPLASVGGSTELLNGRLESQDVEDEGVGAVQDQGKEEGEATEVPDEGISTLNTCGSSFTGEYEHVALRVELASLDLHPVTASLSVRAGIRVLGQFALDAVDTVDGVDKEDQDENESDLRLSARRTLLPACAGSEEGETHTFMPYCSFAINGLFEMNSKVFLRQVKGSGNTRSRKMDISSTRRKNTYVTTEEPIRMRPFT